MKILKQTPLYFLAIIIFTLFLCADCGQWHSGHAYINNKTAYQLLLKFKIYPIDSTLIIQPGNRVDIYKFGGLGRRCECCPCEFDSISLQPLDSSKFNTKDINDQKLWYKNDPNSDLFTHKSIDCEFIVKPADIH